MPATMTRRPKSKTVKPSVRPAARAEQTSKHTAMVDRCSANNYAPLPVVISSAKGVWCKDVDGHKYLDMLSAYSALNFGHAHPEIVKAFVAQAKKLTLTSRAFHNDQFGPFAEEVTRICGFDRVLPMNSGAEGVETALKTARKWGYMVKKVEPDKAEIICMTNNFHGRTISIVSFSDDPQFRADFGPFTPGFPLAEYGNLDSVRALVNANTVGVLVEPIQGEGGIIVPPAGFLKGLRDLCTEHNVLFIADEIQTGLGRTGKLFAYEYEGIKPDLLILGKALGGGMMPVSAVLGNNDVMGVFKPGDHGSTFGGNPLACAVARVALKVLTRDRLWERAAKLGGAYIEKLRTIKSDIIKEVRGKGFLIGIELHESAGGAKKYCKKLKEQGVLCKETAANVLRIAPPLVIGQKDLDWAFTRIEDVLSHHE